MLTALLFLLGLAPGPDLARLGADDWRVREAESARCDNLPFALLLPARPGENPEVNARVRAIRAKQLGRIDARAIERRVHAADYSTWLRLYVLDGESRAYTPAEVFHELHGDDRLADLFFALAPADADDHYQLWLRGPVQAGEYERFLLVVAAYKRGELYRYPAPMPRAK